MTTLAETGQVHPNTAPQIYVVDDDPAIANLVFHNLQSSGYLARRFSTGSQLLESLDSEVPDLVILDIMMPPPNGIEVVRRLRESFQMPILMLTVRRETQTKLVALDLGADDYLTKPFEIAELLARVRAILRRTQPQSQDGPPARYQSGELFIDLPTTRVVIDGKTVSLTPREWAVLKVLVERAGRVVAPREMLREAWGPEYGNEADYIRTYITRLRRKLEPNPRKPAYITVERGLGYRLTEPDVPES